MVSKRRKIPIKEQTAQNFINIEEIDNGFLYTKDGYMMGFLELKARSASLLSDSEKEAHFDTLSLALEPETEPWQLLSIPRTVDIGSMMDGLSELRKETDNDVKLDIIGEELLQMRELAHEGVKENMILLKVYSKEQKGTGEKLKKRLTEISGRLQQAGVEVAPVDDIGITFICKMFADLTTHQEADENGETDFIPQLQSKKQAALQFSPERALVNSITPLSLEFKSNRCLVGGACGRVYGAIQFAPELRPGWAVDLMNSPDAITCITYYPSRGELATAISNAVSQSLTEASTERDLRLRKRYEREVEDGEMTLDDIDHEKRPVGYVTILTMPFTGDEEQLSDVCRAHERKFSANGIKRLKVLGNLQKEAYQSISPYHLPHKDVENICKQVMPLYTLMGGCPMTISQYKDDGGRYFAQTIEGGVMLLDLFKKGGDRTNSNLTIMGLAGTGKSHAIKHLMLTEFSKGTKILYIDPEREIRDICKKVQGTWLDVGGGKALINPLEIRPVPPDDEDEDDGAVLFKGAGNALALHLMSMDIFFSLYLPHLTTIQMACIKNALTELYAAFHIHFDTDISGLHPTDYPKMQDLYELCLNKGKVDSHGVVYSDLALLLQDSAIGGAQMLWNGHTNVDTGNDFICFDTNLANNFPDHVKRAIYYNVLTLCWEVMSKNRNERVLLVCDEAYLLIDPELPQTLQYLRNIEKRCRKYEGGLWLISHSVVDFLAEKIKSYGQALLDIPSYKLFFGADGKNLKEQAELFNLTEIEQQILARKIQREAIAFIGSQRAHVRFNLWPVKLAIIGKGGGS